MCAPAITDLKTGGSASSTAVYKLPWVRGLRGMSARELPSWAG